MPSSSILDSMTAIACMCSHLSKGRSVFSEGSCLDGVLWVWIFFSRVQTPVHSLEILASLGKCYPVPWHDYNINSPGRFSRNKVWSGTGTVALKC